MEKQMNCNRVIVPPRLSFDDVKSRMENWKATQTEGRWAKYVDDPDALNQKIEHQDCYLLELTTVINQHNKGCLSGEEWSIHEWYNRWINCVDGRYFITVARLCENDSRNTRVFLGATLVSRKQYRKDTTLSAIRDLINDTIMGLIDKKQGETISNAIKRTMSSPAKKKEANKIKIGIELEGLSYEIFILFLKRLESWVKRLNSMKHLAERVSEKIGDWMEYFLYSGCTTKGFYQENRSYAPNGFYGMFRMPL